MKLHYFLKKCEKMKVETGIKAKTLIGNGNSEKLDSVNWS